MQEWGVLAMCSVRNKKRRKEEKRKRRQGARKGMRGLVWLELTDRVTDHFATPVTDKEKGVHHASRTHVAPRIFPWCLSFLSHSQLVVDMTVY